MIKALIPVRSGSTRVKNKNVRPFAGTTLLELKIRQMMRIKELDGVVVNSNDDEMLELARQCGAETIKRDEYLATSTVPINEVYEDIARHFDADVMVYSNCTNPLVLDTSISDAIKTYMNLDSRYDSLNTAHLIKEFLWLDGKAVNYDPEAMPRSQELPNILALNFAVNIIKRDDILKAKSIVGHNPYLYPISQTEATDIDNEIDFEFAEFYYKTFLARAGGANEETA